MDYMGYIEQGINGEAPLKIIMRGSIETKNQEKYGVVSLVFATTDRVKAKEKIQELLEKKENPETYYMVYSVPLNTDLTTLEHYPSIAIVKEDLS